MEASARILIADDEAHLLSNIRYALENEGWQVDAHADGEAAWAAYRARRPDLVLLDIAMPLADGLEVLRRIRQADRRVPVMFLTSRDAEYDRVLGLELGADDYLCKPFSLRELAARIRALLRRASLETPLESGLPADSGLAAASSAAFSASAGLPQRTELFVLDPERFEARVAGMSLRLTLSEFRILQALLDPPGQVRTREALAEAAYPADPYPGERAVDCHVKRLRRKIAQAGGPSEAIETIYGLGYRVAENKEPRRASSDGGR